MAFDIGAGLSSAAGSLQKTAEASNLEADKWDLEKQKIALVDQLQTKHEEAGRAFTTSERVATQGFTSGENTANRQNALDIAKMTTDATIKSAGIGAGATLGAASMMAATQVKVEQMKFDLQKPLIDAELLGKQIANTAQQRVSDAKQGVIDARETNDPDKIRAAIQKESDATLGADKNLQVVSLYQTQAKIAESVYTTALSKVTALSSKPEIAMTDAGKAQIKYFQDLADKAQKDFETATRMSQEALRDVPVGMPKQGGPGTGAPPLNQLIPPPVTGAPSAPAAAAPTSQGFTINGPM